MTDWDWGFVTGVATVIIPSFVLILFLIARSKPLPWHK